MSATPWRGTLIFAGTVAAVAATAAVRFSGADVEAEAEGATSAPASSSAQAPAGSSSPAESPAAGSTGDAGSTGEPAASASPSANASSDPAATPSATAPAPADATVTVVGSAVQTRFGALQLSVTFTGSDITAVDALQSPDWHRESQQINAYAIPILSAEAVAADSSGIDAVSGATVTSQAYRESLQAAIDAHG